MPRAAHAVLERPTTMLLAGRGFAGGQLHPSAGTAPTPGAIIVSRLVLDSCVLAYLAGGVAGGQLTCVRRGGRPADLCRNPPWCPSFHALEILVLSLCQYHMWRHGASGTSRRSSPVGARTSCIGPVASRVRVRFSSDVSLSPVYSSARASWDLSQVALHLSWRRGGGRRRRRWQSTAR